MVAERIEFTTIPDSTPRASDSSETFTAVAGNPCLEEFEVIGAFAVVVPLRGEEYPALVDAWDNDDDAVYDQL